MIFLARVLVTCARMMYALNTIRLLHKEGHEVYAADSVKSAGGLYSRYVKKSFIYPYVSRQSEEFINFILKIVEEHKIDVLLPGFEDAFVISYYKDRFEGKVKLLVADFSKVAFLHDKYSVSRLAEKIEIPSPKTVLFRDFEPTEWDFPVIIKPRRNRGALGIRFVKDFNELKKLSGKLNASEYLVQEPLPRVQYCTTGIAYNGKLIANVIYKNIREYPEAGGFGTYRISYDIPEITDYVEKIVEEIDYTGFICADFLYDEKRDTYFITDVNPRMSPGLYVGYASGIDFPKLYVDLLMDPDSVKPIKAKTGTGSYTGYLEVGWFFAVLFKGKFKKLKGFFGSRKGMMDDVWDSKDPLPAFVMFFSMLSSAVIGPLFGGQEEFYYTGCLFESEYFPEMQAVEELQRKYEAV
ncbi:protein of unknown function DUF201 [Kosmotoga olearia TBF 19.5.1]|uniref:ATP-grasp domain-containing protein n=1 Tax=Kosmotoga olearia (strain ATCC BAA-1733 / DSM 21960 / TBF 19.5.1) TaxID=521045 RepID=C5CFV5_KOSOT|nr:protein of unknown function DUF201 [Kosmotoga olearia TBF 19.5.1]